MSSDLKHSMYLLVDETPSWIKVHGPDIGNVSVHPKHQTIHEEIPTSRLVQAKTMAWMSGTLFLTFQNLLVITKWIFPLLLAKWEIIFPYNPCRPSQPIGMNCSTRFLMKEVRVLLHWKPERFLRRRLAFLLEGPCLEIHMLLEDLELPTTQRDLQLVVLHLHHLVHTLSTTKLQHQQHQHML